MAAAATRTMEEEEKVKLVAEQEGRRRRQQDYKEQRGDSSYGGFSSSGAGSSRRVLVTDGALAKAIETRVEETLRAVPAVLCAVPEELAEELAEEEGVRGVAGAHFFAVATVEQLLGTNYCEQFV